MANSKARSGRPSASARGSRSAAGGASRSVRTVAAVSATPTSRRVGKPATAAADPEPIKDEIEDEVVEPEEARPAGQPLWLQIVSFVLAIVGLAISAYETYAHFNGSHLAGCPTGGGGTFNCTAVITSPQSMVFGVLPVAVLGLAFYVAAVPLFFPSAWTPGIQRFFPRRWRIQPRLVDVVRLGSVVVGMGFVMYLIYAELYQIGDVCEYCTGVHIVTFLLFCITVFSAAIWGLGARRDSPQRG
ncbi:MAG: vitamin K epoxide reductase family protein [Trebonia sp.]